MMMVKFSQLVGYVLFYLRSKYLVGQQIQGLPFFNSEIAGGCHKLQNLEKRTSHEH
jgi:hypothetical protein